MYPSSQDEEGNNLLAWADKNGIERIPFSLWQREDREQMERMFSHSTNQKK